MTVDNRRGDSAPQFNGKRTLYSRTQANANSIYLTYKRYYFAAKWVGRFGWAVDLFTVVIGTVLLYILTRTQNPNFTILNRLSELSSADLAILLLISSLVSSFYGAKLRSRDYYRAGQEHQELYDKFIDFAEQDIPSQDKDIDVLRKEYEQLKRRRHRLNQSTPQLGGSWYQVIKLWKKIVIIYQKRAPWKEYKPWKSPSFDDLIAQK